MVSYNTICKKKYPIFYDNVEMVRLNSPWYTKEELEFALKSINKIRFVDINIKERKKPKVENHNFEEMLEIIDRNNVEWIGISNIENTEAYDLIKSKIKNKTTKICAKIETELGCWHAEDIMFKFDGIMVDTEDLAFEIGWEKAILEKERIYKLCETYKKPHFRLSGVIFEYIKPEVIVYTYGAWDLLHQGHLNMLEKAKSYGDKLIVGIVGDEAIRKLKGNDRPIQTQEDRLRIISSLKCVDLAINQEDYNPIQNMEIYQPHILVKGDDWEHIPGEEWIQSHNGILIKPSYSKGWSTSDTVKKIKESNGK